MRAVLLSLVLVLGAGSSPQARLTIVTRTGSSESTLHTSRATLSCDGHTAKATGYLRGHASSACRLIQKATVQRIVEAQPSGRLCSQIYSGPQQAHITGRIEKTTIDVTVTRSDGCGTADWRTLQVLLGDPEH